MVPLKKMTEDFPPRKMSHIESLRLTISIHYSKQDIKKRWKDLCPEFRKSIREEWGDYLNESYPFVVGNDDDFTFLDSYKSW